VTQTQRTGRIVVGLDLGGHDDVVYAAALMHARDTASALHVVHAIPPGTAATPTNAATATTRTAARHAQNHAAAEELRRHTAPADELGEPIAVDYDVRHGDPATVLLSAARHADLIVVGTRGTGHRSPFLLGTVSQDIAVHAACPVLLIPTT
jgi:nucleotide-binding universal stress UspA family protein